MSNGSDPKARKLPAGVHVTTAKGRAYVYAWRGGPRLTAPLGSARFFAEYDAAIAATRTRPPADTIAGLIIEFEASREFRELAPATKKDHRRAFVEIRRKFAAAPVIAFDSPKMRRDLRQWRDGFDEPRRADKLLGSFSRLLSFAVADGALSRNIARDIAARYTREPNPAPVTEKDLEKVLTAPTTPIEVGRAIRVIARSGLSRVDAASLARSHVKADRIDKRRTKSRVRATPPMTPELREAIEACPRVPGVLTILTDARGRPWRPDGLGKAISAACKAAGVAATAHDFRASYACFLIGKGATDEEVAEALGWSLQTVRFIRRHYVSDEAIFAGRLRKFAVAAPDE